MNLTLKLSSFHILSLSNSSIEVYMCIWSVYGKHTRCAEFFLHVGHVLYLFKTNSLLLLYEYHVCFSFVENLTSTTVKDRNPSVLNVVLKEVQNLVVINTAIKGGDKIKGS